MASLLQATSALCTRPVWLKRKMSAGREMLRVWHFPGEQCCRPTHCQSCRHLQQAVDLAGAAADEEWQVLLRDVWAEAGQTAGQLPPTELFGATYAFVLSLAATGVWPEQQRQGHEVCAAAVAEQLCTLMPLLGAGSS